MSSRRLQSRQISSCKFSPHTDGIISCCTSLPNKPFAPGSIDVFQMDPTGENLDHITSVVWNNAILETCWSPSEPDILLGGAVDNSIQLWKLWDNFKKPTTSLLIHNAPVTSVEWRNGCHILSSSLDGHFVLWSPDRCLPATNRDLKDLILQATMCPFSPDTVASVMDKKKLQITDCRCPSDAVNKISCSEQILSCDWSPYDANHLLISSSLGSVGALDLRRTAHFETERGVQCHRGPARRARWLPAYAGLAVSVGFDGATEMEAPFKHENQELEKLENCHDENKEVINSATWEAKEKLSEWLNGSLKIKMTDNRVVIGNFFCTDRDSNVILGSSLEFLREEDVGIEQPRVLGLVMVPGRHIVSIHHGRENLIH